MRSSGADSRLREQVDKPRHEQFDPGLSAELVAQRAEHQPRIVQIGNTNIGSEVQERRDCDFALGNTKEIQWYCAFRFQLVLFVTETQHCRLY